MPLLPGRDRPQHPVPRYPSDMSDAEWEVTEPTLPEPAWKQGRGGRPAQRCRRDTVDAIRYLVREGIRWRAMPADLPHWRTVYDALDGWRESGATEAMHDELRRQCRIAAGRKPEPTAAVIDSQSVKAAEAVSRASRGFDAGRKVNGRKRHIAVDIIGLLLTVLITAAGRAGPRRRQAAAVEHPEVHSPRSSLSGPTAATPANSSPGPRPRSS